MESMHSINRNRQAVPDRERGVVIGIDVSKRKMDFAAYRCDLRSDVFSVKQDAAGLQVFHKLVADLQSEGYEPWIAFEPTGPYSTCLRESLVSSGLRVVQVNPYHVKRTKEVRDNSPGKTDRKDPGVIADLVMQGCYQELVCLDGRYAELRAASAEWASLSRKRTALRNEFQGLLEVWFPEICDVFNDAVCKSVRAIVRKYPTAKAVASARLSGMSAHSGKEVQDEQQTEQSLFGRRPVAPLLLNVGRRLDESICWLCWICWRQLRNARLPCRLRCTFTCLC